MRAEGANNMPRNHVYVDGPGGIRVPFTEVALQSPNAPVLLYDTSGPGSDPAQGLPALREPWIVERGDVETYEGRAIRARDDGRAAARAGGTTEEFVGTTRPPLRA